LPIVFGEVERSALIELAALPEVRAIEEVRVYQASRIEGGGLMKAPQLRSQFGGSGRGVGVAVVDSGVDNGHPELASRVVAQLDATHTTGDGTIDQAGHGTSVAGIVAGSNGGIAPEAHLWAIKVLDGAGRGSGSWILEGFNEIYANRNAFGGVRVVNLSLGDGSSNAADCDAASPAFTQAIANLTDAGIAVFAASGNEGRVNGVAHPACLSKVVSVGAVYDAAIGSVGYPDCSDPATAADRVTCYSNSAPPLDLLAPSHCARAPRPGGAYTSCFGGTSAASPYAAGVAAQLLSLFPNTGPEALRNALMTTGRPVTDSRNGLVRGRVDALAAYQKLGGSAAEFCAPSSTAMCLAGGRFKVEATYQTLAGLSGPAQAVKLTDDSGYLWFFGASNIEAVVKVLDGCGGGGGKYWVFAGGLTNVRTVITVTDTKTGATKTYTNPQDTAFQPIQDTAAFACP
jgi:subtilisin family serine protease